MNQSMIQKSNTQSLPKGVQSTTDYSIFKGLIGNRGIHKPHVTRLRQSIEKRNLLAENPIMVNENMEIIDGQHRLLAASELGVPIYYQIVTHAGLQEVQLLNSNNRGWFTKDYLDSFVAMGKGEYITLQEFANTYRLSVPISMMILSGRYSDRDNLLREFRDGEFQVKDLLEAENMASLISEVRRHSPDMAFADRDCIRALYELYKKTDPKNLTSQLERYQQVVTRRASVKDYLREFENILNQGREKNPIFLVHAE